MGFTKQQIAEQCRAFGPLLVHLPAGVEGAQLLWAISGCESSFGVNTVPRHEPAYDVGGALSHGGNMPALLKAFPHDAACSFGPWQVMFANTPLGAKPEDFKDLAKATRITVGFLNDGLKRWRPHSLTAIGEMWNAGHPMITPSVGVQVYCARLAQNYLVRMPEGA